jgi:hypothetical protein
MEHSNTVRSLKARAAAYERWAREPDRAAALAPARRGFKERFERLADPDGVLDEGERALQAERLRKAHYLRLAALSVASRQRKAGGA